MRVLDNIGGPGSSVGTATRYGLDGPGIEFRWGRDFPHPSRPALGPTQPPIQWVPGLSRGKRPGRGVDYPPHLASSLRKEWSFPVVSFGFFTDNSYGRNMVLGSTQPLTKEYQGYFPGGKGGRCVGLASLPPPCASGSLNLPKSSGPETCTGVAFACRYYTISCLPLLT
jgi:hypothetical protein